jgi:hypothetical protein
MASVRGVNPFTGEPVDYHRPYAAHVHVDGVDVGSIVWEANHLLVSGLPDQVTTTAKDIAEQLGGKSAD